ncbi:polymerase delta-interacting protein 3 [Orussus abietinus]|uniref:polymerase delta-interacting protein 3 n=1 Tax=Orussus abietinus TaxID=222816 RepID=UPI000625BA95|nr:polymerase delta-interacting protein 3 [Orussus abietinus]
MANAGLSLDDIIKKTKPSGMSGRGGLRRGVGRGGRVSEPVRSRGSHSVTDARFKIIQKNREKLTDARDKLAEIAKQSDARLKLEKIRASQFKKIDLLHSSISRKTGRNGRISLTTNKMAAIPPHPPPMTYTSGHLRNSGYRPSAPVEPHYVDDFNMDYNEDYYMESAPLRRTVSNEYAPTPPPPLPVFTLKPSSPYIWVNVPGGNSSRSMPPRLTESERPRDFKVVARSSAPKLSSPSYRDDWSFGSKSRTILSEGPPESKYYESRSHRESRDVGVKSRLDSMPSKPRLMSSERPMGPIARPKSSSSSSTSTGYRIVVSNLQANVTQEDIKELFEDVGELLVSRLVRPGTAEVIYKTLKDATKAVETYHNRLLDGHPMKCLLVNPRPKNNPTAPAIRPLTETRRNASSSYVQPSLGAIHRALFDDCRN